MGHLYHGYVKYPEGNMYITINSHSSMVILLLLQTGDINPHSPLELHFQAGSDVVIWNLNIVRG